MLSTAQAQSKKRFQAADLIVFGLIGIVLYGVVITAERWSGSFHAETHIDLSFDMLPLYALYTFFRGVIAYMISLAFTFIFGYLAAKNRMAEKILIPLLDIGQSIPVLGFLPGLVLGLMTLFPENNIGLELACILMIHTSQVWNMVFSFYSSLKSIPANIYELSALVKLPWHQRLFRIELPFAATGLAWNSLMSMAGGWFFLTICESFVLQDKNFRLPGIGSYMAVAIESGNVNAMISGAIAMMVLIMVMDFVIWRPIIAWTARFQIDEHQLAQQEIPFVTLLLNRSPVIQNMSNFFISVSKKLRSLRRNIRSRTTLPQNARASRFIQKLKQWTRSARARELFKIPIGLAFIFATFWIIGNLYGLIDDLKLHDWTIILNGALSTFLRVLFALILASLWTIPAGILIGLSPRLTRIFQPIIQSTAAFPAPMLYPLALLVFEKIGIHFSIGSSLLMFLGIQWYLLFNVLAGSIGISRELRDSFHLLGLKKLDVWKKLYLPSVFPMLVTGWVTAAGGAWNASIVAEYFVFRDKTYATLGLGALINQSTANGNYSMLAGSLLVMVAVVVGINRTGWYYLYNLSETRFRFER